ncbi:MAG: RNA methyltransferase [Candidatus Thorarchaeota archaeon]|nr:MAG: RNA methyltransferase [Candidatus Thorarchaeota archaeon]
MTEFPNLSVILVEPESPGNIGFTARVLANFGVSDLRIVGKDLRHEQQAQMFSANAKNILDSALIFSDLKTALNGIEMAWAATARTGRNHSVTRAAVPLGELPDPASREGRVALVFGRESAGLTNDEIECCDLILTIPTSGSYRSMNLSHAVAVVLYSLFERYAPEEPRTPTEPRAATFEEREQAITFFDELVDQARIRDFRRPIAKQVFRNLVGRAYVTGREITTLTGTIRKIKELVEEQEREQD